MTTRWQELGVGACAGELDKGTITTAHIMRWSAAVENWHRIHYDWHFATGHDKLPDVLVNGSWKQHVLVQLAKDALGPEGWVWKIRFRYKKMDVARDSIRGRADVVARQERGGYGLVTLKLVLIDQNDAVSTSGYAIGVLPLPGGPPVPYPFVPPPEFDDVRLPTEE